MCLMAERLSVEGNETLAESAVQQRQSNCNRNRKNEVPSHFRPSPWEVAFAYNVASARRSSASVL